VQQMEVVAAVGGGGGQAWWHGGRCSHCPPVLLFDLAPNHARTSSVRLMRCVFSFLRARAVRHARNAFLRGWWWKRRAGNTA